MKQTNKKQTPSQNKQESPKQNQRGPSTAILQSQCQTNSLPQVIWKSRLAWTNDTYQNSIFTFFSLSPFHTLSSFSDVLCFPFPIFVFLLPSSHFFLILSLFFSVVLLFPTFSELHAWKRLKTMHHICWRLQPFVARTRFAFLCH